MAIRDPIEPLTFPAWLAIRANMAIKEPRAMVADAKLVGSINDRTAIDAAITAIAIEIAIRSPLQSLAFFVAITIIETMPPNNPIARTPFIKDPKSIKDRRIADAAKIPIATDIASIVDATPLRSFPPASFVAAVSPTMIPASAAKPTPALAISDHSIPAIIFAANVRTIIAAAIDKRVFPRFSIF